MENLGFEILLFGVIIFVILLDLTKKGRKNKSEAVSPKKIKPEKRPEYKNLKVEDKSPTSPLGYLIERPRNTGIYLLSVLVCKILINATLFKYFWCEGKIISDEQELIWCYSDVLSKSGEFAFGDYIRYVFEINHSSFVFALIVVSFLVWQLNPYIRKK